MAVIDVFNGDADGICALAQLRAANPVDSLLVTGVKRDIQLLNKVDAVAGDKITVLDISLDKNRDGLNKVLAAGAEVFYVDHHFAGEIPQSDLLTTMINPEPDVCTSLLVNERLKGQCLGWAVVGAFGDNLKDAARKVSTDLHLSSDQLELLENLGIYINYNGYGATVEDLHFPPGKLFEKIRPYQAPLDFVRQASEDYEKLESGYHADMNNAAGLKAELGTDSVAVFMLPDETWARRVSGVFSNDLANQFPDRAHAVISTVPANRHMVSVRAPLSNKQGADELCRRFPTGGGRAAAAGINELPAAMLGDFIDQFSRFYST